MIGTALTGQRLPMILQREASECGLACLTMVANFHGKQFGLQTLRELTGLSARGASVRDLVTAGQQVQLRGRALQLDLADLRQLSLPAVLHWDMDHFVILKRAGRRSVVVHDPAVGVKRYCSAELHRHFTGIAIEFSPREDFTAGCDPDAAHLSFKQLFRIGHGLGPVLITVFTLSVLIQVLALLAPLYLQLVIDQGIIKGDMALISMLALMFGVLMLARTLLTYLRGLLLLGATNRLGFQLVSDCFHHLLRLPLSFFERRELGDVVSRFGALDTIKQLLTREAVTVIVDGAFSILTLVLLFLYGPLLATISLAAMVIHTLVRIATLALEKQRRLDTVELAARQQTRFMENVRGIATVKINGMEDERESDWLGRYGQYVNSSFRLGGLQLRMTSLEALVLGSESILVILLGSQMVYSGSLTLGQLMSFIFLKQHFINSIMAMVPKLAELRLMRLEMERVADIRLARPEAGLERPSLFNPEVKGEIVMTGLGFSYPGARNAVLDNLSATIRAGQVTVIVGPSGGGKSTLLKLILGLEEVSSGRLTIDGWSHQERCPRRFREQVAAVLHNEGLLSGTLAFNINLGVDAGNKARISLACKQAGISGLIDSLPMGMATRVGELGSQFSAGQVRRILLARAFYRQPRLLILDETLTHLGQQASRELLTVIRSLGVTTLVVSHDPEVIASADAVLRIGCTDVAESEA
jgi:ATP-binding cassette subfamily B protein RaxB